MSQSHSNRKSTVRSLVTVLIIGLLLLTAACQRRSQLEDQAPELAVTFATQPESTSVGAGQVIVEIRRPDGEPIEGATVEIRGDMTHAGMTPEFGQARSTGAGSYIAPFQWTMAGDWIMSVQAQLPDGRVLLRTFELQVAPAESSREDK